MILRPSGENVYGRAGRRAGLEEAELRHAGVDALEELTLGLDQFLRGPGRVAGHLAHRLEGAHGVDVAAEDHEDLSVDVSRVGGGQEGDQVGDVLGVPGVETPVVVLLGQAAEQVLGHAGPGAGGDGVGRDAVAPQLTGQYPGQGGDAGFGRTVVGLTGVAVEARLRGGVDDPTSDVLSGLGLVAPVYGGMVRRREVALEVHADDIVPVGLLHVEGHLVPQDPGVVDQDVEAAKGVDGLVDHVLAAFPRTDVVAVDRGLSATLFDEGDHVLGRVLVGRRVRERPSDVVDDDPGALARQEERLLASDAPPGSRDDGNLAVEQTHGATSFSNVFVSVVVLERRTSAQVPCGASSIADASGQGQNRSSAVAVTSSISAVVSARARARPNRSVRLTTSIPVGGERRSAGSAPPQIQTTGHRPPTRDNTPPGTLPRNEGGSRCPSPVTTTSAPASRASRSTSPATRSNPWTSRAPSATSPPASPPAAPAPGSASTSTPKSRR